MQDTAQMGSPDSSPPETAWDAAGGDFSGQFPAAHTAGLDGLCGSWL